MTTARKRQVALDATPYYHLVCRCVRRAFLCGRDKLTGRSFAHRRRWIEDGLLRLSEIFAIDVAAYAVMENHYHVVVHVDEARCKGWSAKEVAERWSKLFCLPPSVEAAMEGAADAAEWAAASEFISEYRERLMSMSWFMRCINESVARRANREDRCTGRFWEGRFKSQALLGEAALLKCMAYVDLNPIRAAVATTPEESLHTSIHRRLHGDEAPLLPMDASDPDRASIPISFPDYLELVDQTGRILRSDKRGAIPGGLAPILDRLNIDADRWRSEMKHYGTWYGGAVGTLQDLKAWSARFGRRWVKGPPSQQPA